MTISGWITFAVLAFIICGIAFLIAISCESRGAAIGVVFAAVFLIICILFGMIWYYNNTASGQRALIDERSNLNNGIERVINIYTADGNIIATYEGKIDIDMNDGGYVKFDFDGNRYIYYNCFIETIATIN